MSTTEIRDAATDKYKVLTQYDASAKLEVAIAQALVQSAYNKTTINPTSGGVYTSPANDSSWNCVDISFNSVNTSAISNYPNGTVTEYSVISSQMTTDVSVNSYTTYISSVVDGCTNNRYTFQSLPSSSSYYDSNYVFTQSLKATCPDNQTGSYVNATFDTLAENANIQYAMQSRWNTVLGPYNGLQTVGPDPTAITQDDNFNTNSAFAQQGSASTDASYVSYWFSANSDGSLTANMVNPLYQPNTNRLLVGDRDMTGVTLNVTDDVGIFRLQQASDVPVTTVSKNGGSLNNITTDDLNNMPLFDGNGNSPLNPLSSKNSLPIPGVMTNLEFRSLVNNNVLNTVADKWTYKIDIATTPNSGYNINTSHPLISDLNNSNLLDNPYYMANYVSNNHSISFSNSTVDVIPSTNGVTSDANSINVNLSQGEKLQDTYAGVDGQIIINTHTIDTRYTDLNSNNLVGSYWPKVYYAQDTTGTSLSSEEINNPYFSGMWQKVAQQSSVTNPAYWLKANNDAIMTLYTSSNGIVDSSYNASDFDFSFNKTPFNGSDNIHLWKINSINDVILNPQSFYNDPNYSTFQEGIATTGIISNLTESINYNSYRILLTAKTKENLGLYNAVTDASGWTLSYSGVTDTFLHSDSAQATSINALPIYNALTINDIDNGAPLYFTYTYGTREISNSPAGLVDYVDISFNIYTPDSGDISYNVTIYQPQITRVYDNLYADVSYVVVPDASYTFIGQYYNKQQWQLVYVTANSKYNASFSANYGPFTNLILSVNNILQTDQYYAIRNLSNGRFAPQIALDRVSAPTISNLNTVFEVIEPSPGNQLSISGIFTKNDLKPFMSIAQGETTPSNWVNIGTSINTDVYYGLPNTDSITPSGTLETYIQYTPFSNSVNSSVNVVLDQLNYYMPFVYDQSNNAYSLQSFTTSASNIPTNTNIASTSFLGNTKYLTLTNGYSNATNWSTSGYTLDISYNLGTESTTFTVNDTLGNVIFTITTLDNTIFLGDFIVSYIPKDYYRTERLLGMTAPTATYGETFITQNYTNGLASLSPLLQGIYIGDTVGVTNYLSPSNCPNLGSYQSFRVISDYMSINEVGTTSPPTSSNELGTSYNGGSLIFQYNNSPLPNYSATFTFPKYRGYYSYTTTNPNEYYTITRDATVVNFNVAGNDPLTGVLTSNMYYNESFIANNLQNIASELVANLGVTGSFYYSIPPTGSTLTYPVTVVGDSVTVSIVNPNYLGDASNIIVPSEATPVINPKLYSDSMTLKNYGQNDMYTFSGNWYQTNRLMAIRPSRVKLNNTSYPYNSLSYQIQINSSVVTVYKARNQTTTSTSTFNWLGNPILNGSQDPDVQPSSSDWMVVNVYPASKIYDGIDIGRKHIYQNPLYAVGFRIVYIISAPPYYKFDQISSANCPTIPYNYNTQYTSNRKQIYMPYISTSNGNVRSSFNPFAPSTVYTDINGNSTTVINDSNYFNNVIFNLSSVPSITDAAMDPDSTRYGIIVPGTNLTVSLYTGLYPDTNSGAHTNPIWNAPVTSIPSTPNISQNALILRGRDNSGAISFSALQYPADIGYPSGVTGYLDIFKTDISSNWYNIDFKMDNSAWFNNNNPITYFDTNASGIRPTLYTVINVNNPLNQINKRRVYKYTTPGTIDIDASGGSLNGYRTFNITFSSRSYHDFDISFNPVFPSNSTTIWKYNDLLNNTVIPNTSSISWTTDASYTETTYVSWCFGNSTTSTRMITDLFAVQDTQQKWVYIHLEPFMRYMNQFNLQVGSVEWDGTIVAPLMNTRVVTLAPELTNPTLINNNYTTQQYSESTL